MNWLHTWAGVVLGVLLFAVFWTGTLCVFDREIDRWMMPATRLSFSGEPISIDKLRDALAALPAKISAWGVVQPTERDPTAWIGYPDGAGGLVLKYFDPVTYQPLPEPGTRAATRFLYPLHYSLNIGLWDIGLWLVGLAGMAMLALCTSGVIIHRKIFVDFFTLRQSRQPHRLILDVHTVAGTVGFVFYVGMAFSGLTIFVATYFPFGWQAVFKGDRQAYLSETYDSHSRPPSGTPGTLASVDAMIAQAMREWGGATPAIIRTWHPRDANAVVEVRPPYQENVSMRTDAIYFDGATGAVLHRGTMRPATAVQQFVTGIHFVQFRHWTLRWIYFALGLLGCALIASGLLFWLESRRKAHAAAGLRGVPLVEGLTVGGVTGIVAASLAYFVANRLLPRGATLFGIEREGLEMSAFYLVWAASFAHAWLRPRRAWAEQCMTIAVLAAPAVALNAITTGDHPARAIVQGKWSIAGMDLMLLLGALLAALAALKLTARLPELARKRLSPGGPSP